MNSDQLTLNDLSNAIAILSARVAQLEMKAADRTYSRKDVHTTAHKAIHDSGNLLTIARILGLPDADADAVIAGLDQ